MAEMMRVRFVGGPIDGREDAFRDPGIPAPIGVPCGPSVAPAPGSVVWKGSAFYGTTHAAWYEPEDGDEGGRVVYRFAGYREV